MVKTITFALLVMATLFMGTQKTNSIPNEIKVSSTIFIAHNQTEITARLQGRRDVYRETLKSASSGEDPLELNIKIEEKGFYDLNIAADGKYFLTVYIDPGDAIIINIGNDSAVFEGPNKVLNQLLFSIQNELPAYPKFEGNSKEYFDACRAIYEIQQRYLKNNPLNAKLSAQEITLIKDYLYFEYAHKLIIPVMWDNRLDVDLLREYSYRPSIEDLKRSDLFYSKGYEYSIMLYTRHIFTDHALSFSKDHLNKEIKTIRNSYSKPIQQYLLLGLCFEFSKKLIPSNTLRLKEVVDSAILITENPYYQRKLEFIESRLKNLSYSLPDSVLTSTLLTKEFEREDLYGILAGNDKYIVIDFWASWCKPCIEDMNKSAKFRKEIAEKAGIEWVYISIDSDQEKWMDKIEEIQLLNSNPNNYLIADIKTTPYADYFKMYGIPQYVLISPDGRLILDNLPKPSNEEIFTYVIEDLENQ